MKTILNLTQAFSLMPLLCLTACASAPNGSGAATALEFTAGSATKGAPTNMNYNTTPTQYVDVEGIKYAYRTLGAGTDAPPLLLLQHFTGTMDDWDPKLVEGLALHRRVIVFDNAGVGRSGGTTPDSVQGTAQHVEALCDALKLEQVDLLGFSLGGFVAQQMLFERPNRIRKVILVGTGPQGGTGIKDLQAVMETAMKKGSEQRVHPKTVLFFSETKNGKNAAAAFMDRIGKHTVDADPPVSNETMQAQAKAIVTWGSVPPNDGKLQGIRQPVLIVNGSNDVMVPTSNSVAMFQQIPSAQLALYPDSGHGALFQYHDQFVALADTFLRAP